MALQAMNVRTTQVVAAPVVASIPSWRQANSGTSVRVSNGAVVFKRASLMVVRAESNTEPGPAGRGNTSSAPTTPQGMSGSEAPLGVVTKSAPLDQGSEVPVSERMAYICQDCGYVYDDQKPFEDVEEDYTCPQCSAPKARFMLANASVGEVLDTTKDDSQN